MFRKLPFILLILPAIALAEIPAQPYPNVRYSHEQSKDPPQQLFIAQIDLTDKNVQIKVAPGGKDPDGPQGKWQTVLKPPTKIAEREHFDIVINGDFFSVGKKDAEGEEAQKVFESGIGATVVGPAMTDGKLWGPAAKPRAAFIVHQDHVSIAQTQDPPSDATQIIAGSDIIVRGGKNVAPKGKGFPEGPHPRTAIGIADKGKRLVLVVGDGRKPGIAKGWSLADLADVLIKLGCDDALNLDGGGSSMMAIRNPKTHKLEIVNTPSDGKERSVGNVLGVIVTPKSQGATQR